MLLSVNVQAANFSARVDRYDLQPGESLLLTLELDQPDYFVDPDITPLQQDFELLSSSHQPLVEENGQSFSRWLLRLQPRHEGSLTIPALRLGELLSAPIRIEVSTRPEGQTAALEPVYIDSSLDREELYIQGQALLTVRIYHSVPLYSDGQVSPLNIEGARIHNLGKPALYQQYVHGIRYGVIEVRYAIFPQITGILTIAPQTFTATLAGDDASSLEAPRLVAPGRKIQVKSAQIPLRVKPPPASFPADAAWLPARSVQLEQRLIPAGSELSLEQPLEHSITLRIAGQPGSAVSPLLPALQPGFHLYSNPVEYTQTETAEGVHSTIREQQLLVARQAGSFQLDALRMPWWNTETDSLEWVTTTSHDLHVVDIHPALPDTSPGSHHALRQWQLLSLFLALTTLTLALLWRRARKMPAIIAAPTTPGASRLLEELKRACQQHQPQQARAALDLWLRHHAIPTSSLVRSAPNLQQALTELNQALYTPNTGQHWNGQALWQAVNQLDNDRQQNHSQQLPPLYPP